MRKQLRTYTMGAVAAILTIWLVARTLPAEAEADAAPPPPRAVIEAAVFPDVPAIDDPGANTYGAASDRNPFAFVSSRAERSVVEGSRGTTTPPPVAAAEPAAVPAVTEAPPEPPRPPAFPYRVLGRIGNLAVLSRDGEITNVPVGETIGGEFVLRAIGVDAVEIGFVRFPDVQRIPIGE